MIVTHFRGGEHKIHSFSNALWINCHLKVPGSLGERKSKLARFAHGGHSFTLPTIPQASFVFLCCSESWFWGPLTLFMGGICAVNGASHVLRFCAVLQDVPFHTCISTVCYCHNNPDYLWHPQMPDKNSQSQYCFFMLCLGWRSQTFSAIYFASCVTLWRRELAVIWL